MHEKERSKRYNTCCELDFPWKQTCADSQKGMHALKLGHSWLQCGTWFMLHSMMTGRQLCPLTQHTVPVWARYKAGLGAYTHELSAENNLEPLATIYLRAEL